MGGRRSSIPNGRSDGRVDGLVPAPALALLVPCDLLAVVLRGEMGLVVFTMVIIVKIFIVGLGAENSQGWRSSRDGG